MAKAIVACDAGPVRFLHPGDWTPEVTETEGVCSVSLQSPGVSFAIVAVLPPDAEPEEVIGQAVESLRDEHPALELEDLDDGFDELQPEIAGCFSAEAVFFSVDTLSFCWLRSWRTTKATLFLLLQSPDVERSTSEAVFTGICRSFRSVQSN